MRRRHLILAPLSHTHLGDIPFPQPSTPYLSQFEVPLLRKNTILPIITCHFRDLDPLMVRNGAGLPPMTVIFPGIVII